MKEEGGGRYCCAGDLTHQVRQKFLEYYLCDICDIDGVRVFKVVWMARTHMKWSRSYPLPAIFRAPPDDRSASYAPFVSPITADLISNYTLPVVRRILEEVLAVGACYIYILPYSSVSVER